jgi:DNA-binding transcriptional ArsR family regulator
MSNYPINDAEELAELFKGLSNPHRLKIFVNLARLGDFFSFAGGDVPPQLVAFAEAQEKIKGEQR